MKKMKQKKSVTVATSRLTPSAINPPSRTAARALEELRVSIEKEGILSPIHALRNGTIVDGHRRHACAMALGVTEVQVIYHDVSSPEEL